MSLSWMQKVCIHFQLFKDIYAHIHLEIFEALKDGSSHLTQQILKQVSHENLTEDIYFDA